MASSNNERLRYRYGKCLNDECPKCKTKEIITLPARKDFVCPDCGKQLRECPPPKKTSIQRFVPMIVIAVLVSGALLTWLLLPSSSKSEATTQDSLTATVSNQPMAMNTAVETDTVTVAESVENHVEIDSMPNDNSWPSAEPVQTVSTSTQTKQTSSQEEKSQSGAHALGYADWKGGWRNGKPHGNGTMTYTQSHLIDSRDDKGRIASPGEYIIGEWDNGHLVQGRWFKKDGTKEAIIIGKAG